MLKFPHQIMTLLNWNFTDLYDCVLLQIFPSFNCGFTCRIYIYIYTGVPGSNLPMCTCISVSKHCCGHMIRSTILGVSLALDTEVAGGEMLIDM